MEAPVIDIGTVLNKFNQTVDEGTTDVKSFGIKFLTEDGHIREMTCRKNVRAPKHGLSRKLDERGKLNYNLKYNGVMLLRDEKIDEPRSVKVATIGKFRDHKSEIWQNVRH